MKKVVLFEPEIPQNTGNIIRTCSATGSSLILIPPLGFSMSDRMLKRAGLDYHHGVDISQKPTLEKAILEQENGSFYFFSSKGDIPYTEIEYAEDTMLIFGSEGAGLPSSVFQMWPDKCVRIPMKKNTRCLNLSNAVAIGLYEALRQNDFAFNN